jgi:hypothetical protein
MSLRLRERGWVTVRVTLQGSSCLECGGRLKVVADSERVNHEGCQADFRAFSVLLFMVDDPGLVRKNNLILSLTPPVLLERVTRGACKERQMLASASCERRPHPLFHGVSTYF